MGSKKQRERQNSDRNSEELRLADLTAERDFLTKSEYDAERRLRVAQCREKMGELKIAVQEYRTIYTDFPESRLADRSQYFAFNALFLLQDFDAAKIEAAEYLSKFETGRFRDEITLASIHIEITTENLLVADKLGRELLEQKPAHRYLDQVNYLLGFVHFQQNDFATARPFFESQPKNGRNEFTRKNRHIGLQCARFFSGNFLKQFLNSSTI